MILEVLSKGIGYAYAYRVSGVCIRKGCLATLPEEVLVASYNDP